VGSCVLWSSMSIRHSLLIVGALATALLLAQVPAAADREGTDTTDLLRLARLADAMHDSAPRWAEEVERLPELPRLVEHIAGYIEEEGYGSGDVPVEVTADRDFGELRSLVSGRYDIESGKIELNERFLTDPSWEDRPWLGVLVHEMLHAEGYPVEAQVQLITTEVLATMANDGYPGALVELADRIRRHALQSAWWMAAYEHTSLPTSLAETNTSPTCEMGCTQVSGEVDDVEAARRDVFDAGELRRALARERFWLRRSQRDYDIVLGSYVAEPLGVLLARACGDGPELRLKRDDGWPPLYPSVDDTGAFLKEIGWC